MPGLFDSSTRSSVTAIAAIPIGMLTKKIQRQPAHSVRMPPTSGPIATAAPVVAPQMPNAVPRSRPWNAFASNASETANMTPPPTPCTSAGGDEHAGVGRDPAGERCGREQHEADREHAPAAEEVGERPAASTVVASVSAYASTTHCSCEKLASRSRWMSGSATFTTVMSSSNMKIAVHTAMSVHHLWSSPATARAYPPRMFGPPARGCDSDARRAIRKAARPPEGGLATNAAPEASDPS